MLLSIPTWIIHISSMLEWAIAFVLLYKYGQLIKRKDIQHFAKLMIPHWLGGLCVILFHISGDQIHLFLDLSKIINFFGSLALITGSFIIINHVKARNKTQMVAVGLLPAVLLFVVSLPDYQAFVNFTFQLSSLFYLVFLLLVLYIYKIDKSVFSWLTVFGFWFVLIFVGITVYCIHLSTTVRGFPTLTHDDLLHGFAESLLSISNLMIVLGINQKIKRHQLALSTDK